MEAIAKFEEGFFIKEQMEEQDSVSKVKDALKATGNGGDDSEEEKTDEKDPMEQSFYRKQGIDFLNFQRPGTAYGKAAFAKAAANTSSTSFYSTSKPAQLKPIKPKDSTAMMAATSLKPSSLSALWMTRAENILD